MYICIYMFIHIHIYIHIMKNISVEGGTFPQGPVAGRRWADGSQPLDWTWGGQYASGNSRRWSYPPQMSPGAVVDQCAADAPKHCFIDFEQGSGSNTLFFVGLSKVPFQDDDFWLVLSPIPVLKHVFFCFEQGPGSNALFFIGLEQRPSSKALFFIGSEDCPSWQALLFFGFEQGPVSKGLFLIGFEEGPGSEAWFFRGLSKFPIQKQKLLCVSRKVLDQNLCSSLVLNIVPVCFSSLFLEYVAV